MVPGRLKSRIFLTFGSTSVVGRQPNAPAAFTSGEIPGTHFQWLRRPQGTWFCRKEWTVRLVAQRCMMFGACKKRYICRSQLPRDLKRRSAAARLLRLWVRFPPGAWMLVSCGCCVLSAKGLCDELITRPEESYRLLCVVVCDLENS